MRAFGGEGAAETAETSMPITKYEYQVVTLRRRFRKGGGLRTDLASGTPGSRGAVAPTAV